MFSVIVFWLSCSVVSYFVVRLCHWMLDAADRRTQRMTTYVWRKRDRRKALIVSAFGPMSLFILALVTVICFAIWVSGIKGGGDKASW